MLTNKWTISGLLTLVLAASCCWAPNAMADFGFRSAGTALTDGPDGGPLRQAGAHPDFRTQIFLNGSLNPIRGAIEPDGTIRDVTVALPPGLVGNPQAAEHCTPDQLQPPNGHGAILCPLGSQIGLITVVQTIGGTFVGPNLRYGLYNMVPKPGEPAEFGFVFFGAPVTIVPQIRPGDYGISSASKQTTQAATVFALQVDIWGVPAAHSHDGQRRGADPTDPLGQRSVVAFPGGGEIPLQATPRTFLSLPTSCSPTPQAPVITANSWEHPDLSVTSSAGLDDTPFLFGGCDQLPFSPSIDVQAVSHVAGRPTALNVDLKVPQSDSPDALATAHLRKAVVRLPVGMGVSASSAAGLGACSPSQIGVGSNDPPSCPDSSKIGTVEITTPLLSDPLEGDVILAAQNDNPFNSLLALYIVVKGPGFYIKLPARVDADPVTGQLTTTVDNAPQLPFSEMKLKFSGGAQAPLKNPSSCGVFHTASELTSWASDLPVTLDSPMVVDQNCDAAGRFEPVMSAGVLSPAAGVSSPFTFTLARPDGEQDLSGLSLSLPAGLLGHVGSVPLCAEAQAAAGTCSAASQVGSVVAAAGAGPEPSYLPQAGKAPTAVYLAGPYRGAPFSLTIVVPAQVGPFDLGTVVLRAAIYIDPHDAHVTVVSDPFPTILQGIPLDTQKLNLTLDRPGFMVTPTSCNPLQIAAHVTSTQGTVVDLTNRFQLGGCSDLPFKPVFSASTVARTSRANGASLDAKIVIGERGEANAHVVSVDLPKQLPSRLTTIQKACLAATFAANPASCPPESLVGTATSKTEVLADPLSGPAYLVSHGGAAFPDLVVVLQGDGVRFDLVGAINISSKGITSTKFSNAPDAPIDTFELKLPQGPHSILTSNGSLCVKPLVMPTTLTAYNGKQITQSTKIKVSGCPKAKKAKKHKAKKHKAKGKKGAR